MAAPIEVWSLVVPVKRLELAKSRLAVEVALRRRLALAMATDTVRAALACEVVAEVVVVTDDAAAASAVTSLGARVVADSPDAGLNPALSHGARLARNDAVCALSSDLPALVPAELAAVLAAVGRQAPGVVADAAGTGTTLLAAASRRLFRPAFGAGSFTAHRAAGAEDLTAAAGPSVRQDVDTLLGLRVVADLGVGPTTAAVLDEVRAETPLVG